MVILLVQLIALYSFECVYIIIVEFTKHGGARIDKLWYMHFSPYKIEVQEKVKFTQTGV